VVWLEQLVLDEMEEEGDFVPGTVSEVFAEDVGGGVVNGGMKHVGLDCALVGFYFFASCDRGEGDSAGLLGFKWCMFCA
jgi:hypothetical protein